jgi:hypothetical protein
MLEENKIPLSVSPFIEVLIGTYARPLRTIDAIKSVLQLNLDSVIVRCNSNGYEPLLEEFCKNRDNVIYTYFDTNLGACKNWTYLLKNTKGEFCLLLSDEDEIDKKLFSDFLKYLSINNDISAAIVPFIDQNNGSIVGKIGKDLCSILSKKYLVYRSYRVRGYMSGFIFRSKFMHKVLLDEDFCLSCNNKYDVYLHCRLLRSMFDYGSVLAINTPIVLKNIDSGYGGDAYSHINKDKDKDKPDLNPEIYSIYSRIRQHSFHIYLLYKEDWKMYERVFIHLRAFMSILHTISIQKGEKKFVYFEVKKAQIDSNFQIRGIDKVLAHVLYFSYIRVLIYHAIFSFFRVLGLFFKKSCLKKI